ncbi:MAG: hypothetical protein LBT26_08765 [Clostridiales Family XIII bacterium]|jgi:hypothetical protein|nr:hypothetical protein [Clostridiales Family XIII bacterium]
MEEILLRFESADLLGPATEQLKKACRFDPGKEMHRRMLEEALAFRGKWADGLRLAVTAAFYAPEVLSGAFLDIAGIRLRCAAFAQIRARDIREVVLYAMALHAPAEKGGEGKSGAGDLTRLFYADLWGNAYVEAGAEALRAVLRERMEAREDAPRTRLSEAFGPGYYGMPAEEMKTLARMLDFSAIDARVEENGVIYPPKACAGIYFAAAEGASLPAASCSGCAGNTLSCDFCVRRKTGQTGPHPEKTSCNPWGLLV